MTHTHLLFGEHAAGVNVDGVLIFDGLVVSRLGQLGRVVEKPRGHRLGKKETK